MILHGYCHSTAAWRVRIALGLKGLTAQARRLLAAETACLDRLAFIDAAPERQPDAE